MTNLPEASDWVAGIYQIEQTDPVLGGPPNIETGAGIANVQAQQLADRTAWLKAQIAAAVAFVITTGTGLNGGGAIDGGLTLSADLADQAVAEAGSNNLQLMTALRTKQAIDVAINALVGAAPAQLDTLNELATAIADNGDTSAALTALIAAKFGIADLATQAQAEAGTDNTSLMTPLRAKELGDAQYASLVSGSSAWVNLNGTGVLSVRKSHGVSSVTDEGPARYRVHFSPPMPDADYVTLVHAGNADTAGDERYWQAGVTEKTTTSFAFYIQHGNSQLYDVDTVSIVIFGGS
jgi:hypothetical protein